MMHSIYENVSRKGKFLNILAAILLIISNTGFSLKVLLMSKSLSMFWISPNVPTLTTEVPSTVTAVSSRPNIEIFSSDLR